jgi:hypothetical protein
LAASIATQATASVKAARTRARGNGLDRENPVTLFSHPALEHLPLGLNHPSEKKMLKIKKLEHVLRGKVGQLFRNML